MSNQKGQPKQFWKEVAIAYPCETCGAGPGDFCRTGGGNRMFEVHASRSIQASENNWDHPDAI